MSAKLARRNPLAPRTLRLVCGVMVVMAALSACGTTSTLPGQQGRSPRQLLDDAAKNLLAARSYHISSDTIDGVNETAFELDVSGNKASGTVTGGQGKWTVHLISIGDTLYMWGKSYWIEHLSAAQAKQIGDQCMRITPFSQQAKQGIEAFTTFADTKGYATGLQTPDGEPAVEGATTFQGKPALSIVDGHSKVFVDAGKTTYPLHVEIEFGTGQGYTNYSKFNATAPIPAAPTGCLDLAVMSGVGASPSPGTSPNPALTDVPPLSTPAV